MWADLHHIIFAEGRLKFVEIWDIYWFLLILFHCSVAASEYVRNQYHGTINMIKTVDTNAWKSAIPV
jgi:hypothetical protein